MLKEFLKETGLLLALALPTCIINLASSVGQVIIASVVGREFGKLELDGFSLSVLMGNLLTLTLLSGLFSALDTLSPQAFSAGNYEAVGHLAIRGLVGGMAILVPINLVLFFFMEPLMVAVGQDPQVSQLCAQWYSIYLFYFPFCILYYATWKSLAAQSIMMPTVYVTLFCTAVVLPLAVVYFTEWFGYIGSAMAMVLYGATQSSFLIIYLMVFKPHDERTFPKLTWEYFSTAMERKKFSAFVSLGLGGMLANSEWMYWEITCFLIGTFGVVELSVQTIATQVLTVDFMIPWSIGVACTIRMGHILPRSYKRAQCLCLGVILVCTVLFAAIAMLVYYGKDTVLSFFIDDESVKEGCDERWLEISVFCFNSALYALNMDISYGLGLQWPLGIVTVFCLWVFGFPMLYWDAELQGGGIAGAWRWINPAYALMNVLLFIIFLTSDWAKIGDEIREREGISDSEDQEDSISLLEDNPETEPVEDPTAYRLIEDEVVS